VLLHFLRNIFKMPAYAIGAKMLILARPITCSSIISSHINFLPFNQRITCI
jgi:hypothetical protein